MVLAGVDGFVGVLIGKVVLLGGLEVFFGLFLMGVTIVGLSGGGIPQMLPRGIRRLIIPESLGYQQLAAMSKERCVQDGRPGPIPPPNQAFEEYQRFKNIYCNTERQYQPDVVMDIKLYGARSR